MFIQVAWGRLKAGAYGQFERHYRERLVPLTRTMKGFRERQLWRGAADAEEVISWSVWDSLADLRTYETSGTRRELAQEAEQYYQPWAYPRGEFWVKHFEVVYTDRC
ncbi:MAG: antibiotic biosynthesis monooxygenase [Chloroflexota bacterium]